jgi:hypothetical protein
MVEEQRALEDPFHPLSPTQGSPTRFGRSRSRIRPAVNTVRPNQQHKQRQPSPASVTANAADGRSSNLRCLLPALVYYLGRRSVRRTWQGADGMKFGRALEKNSTSGSNAAAIGAIMSARPIAISVRRTCLTTIAAIVAAAPLFSWCWPSTTTTMEERRRSTDPSSACELPVGGPRPSCGAVCASAPAWLLACGCAHASSISRTRHHCDALNRRNGS